MFYYNFYKHFLNYEFKTEKQWLHVLPLTLKKRPLKSSAPQVKKT